MKKIKIFYFLIGLLTFFVLSVNARDFPINKEDIKRDEILQETRKKINGRVLDINGEPLMGVNVAVDGISKKATITDVDGLFTVYTTKENSTLKFSYIGFKTLTVKLTNKTYYSVTMEENVNQLQETVVVGMGSQRKASVIGAVSSVQLDELRVPQRSLTAALNGHVAGTTIIQSSGEPGYDEPSFWIRGISSFGANNNPLILVDGVERDMSNLSIEEIASISILKDASATAVYGVRAANGVVLITTKQGIAQKPVIEGKVEYNISDLPQMPKLLDGANYAELYNEAFGSENYSQEYIRNLKSNVNRFLYPNVDWFNQIFKKWSNGTNAAISIRGGGERARYFINMDYLGDNGNLRDYETNDYDSNIHLHRYNFRSNLDITVTKSTTINLEIGANLTDMHEPGVGNESIYSTYLRSPAEELFYWAYLSSPLSCPVQLPIEYGENGVVTKWGWGAPSQVGEKNPMERLMGSGYNSRFNTEVMTQLVLTQDLSFLTKGLNFKGFFSFDSNSYNTQFRQKTSSTYSVGGIDDETGQLITKEVDKGDEFLNYSHASSSNRAIEAKAQLNYDRLFGKYHRVGGMVMLYGRDYVDATASSAMLSLPYRKLGIAFRGTYSYRDTYFAEFNLGHNGSENFPKHHRFGWFPAFAAGYLISDEPFWKSKAVSFLKLRGSVGLVGSDALPSGYRYGYLSTWGSGLGGYSWGYNPSSVSGVGEAQIGNADLTWEKGLKTDVGIEAKFLKDMISLDLDYFHERRYDILIQRRSLPATAGLNTQPFANMGKMRNEGFEATAGFNKKFRDLVVKLSGNITYTKNKILAMDEPKTEWAYRMRTGQRYGQQFGLTALGLFKDEEDIKNSPQQMFGEVRPGDVKYKDWNGDNVINEEDEHPIGYSNIPDWVYGFGAQLMWHGFDVGVFFRGQAHVSYDLGGDTFIPFSQGVGKGNLFEKALDRWTEDNPNPNAFYPRLSNGKSANNWQPSTRTIYDGSFLRLSNMEIGYAIPRKLVQKWGLQGLRIYFIGTNLALISKWKLWDPETGSPNGSKYPNPRKLSFGFRFTI